MDNLSNKIRVVSIAFLLLVGGVAEEEESSSRMSAIIDATKRLFSLSSSSDYNSNWFLRWHSYISPTSNLDFRDEGTTTDKLKEAMVKTKATVEDSAKSAAEFAEDAVDNTVKKLKDTFSSEL